MARPFSRFHRSIAGRAAPYSAIRARGLWLRLLCALLLVLALSVPRPPVVAAAEAGIDLSQYTLPDGTLPDLCLSPTDADGASHAPAHHPGCDACRLQGAPAVPGPAAELFARAEYRRVMQSPVPEDSEAGPVPLYRISSRAPPALRPALFAAGGRLPWL
ncbi:hypothetical protein [Ancylobacter sp. IITR112]|uniref:hypothetical protein n=1 Tax=Ancylobacter sp. IITR112 TaxID=3138073 RepID=UPI00352A10E9